MNNLHTLLGKRSHFLELGVSQNIDIVNRRDIKNKIIDVVFFVHILECIHLCYECFLLNK